MIRTRTWAGRDDHLPDRLRLGVLAVEDLVELGHAVDQVGHLGAEVAVQRLQGVGGVLHRVVQQRGDQRGGVHAQLGEDLRDGEWMGDVRLAALAQLAAVHALRDAVRAAQGGRIRPGVDGAVGADQGGDRVRAVGPGQHRAQSLGEAGGRAGTRLEVHSNTPSPLRHCETAVSGRLHPRLSTE
jgi:hypothetical protein